MAIADVRHGVNNMLELIDENGREIGRFGGRIEDVIRFTNTAIAVRSINGMAEIYNDSGHQIDYISEDRVASELPKY